MRLVVITVFLALSMFSCKKRCADCSGGSFDAFNACIDHCNRLDECGINYRDISCRELCDEVNQVSWNNYQCDRAGLEYFSCNINTSCESLQTEPCPLYLQEAKEQCEEAASKKGIDPYMDRERERS